MADELLSNQLGLLPAALPTEQANQLAERVRALVAVDMELYSVQVARDQRQQGAVVLSGRLLRPSGELFGRWLETLNREGYTPLLRPLPGGGPDEVSLHVVAAVAPASRTRPWINALLFALTVVSTLFAGSLYAPNPISVDSLLDLFAPRQLLSGWPFAATLLSILLAHEFGHYLAARLHRVDVTLPYFLPMLPPIGTLGAFIRLRAPVPDRRRLFDIGVAGPLAGVALAVPLLFVGLSTSPVEVPDVVEGVMREGNSILYFIAKLLVFGKVLPNPVTGEDVLMNQVTFAAWIGLLVTALNLLPVGQLDGGHTVFAIFGEGARRINQATVALITVLAIAGLQPLQQRFPALVSIGWTGWFIWLALILVVIRPYHPPALDDVTPLDRRRRLIGYGVIALFLVTFTAVPLRPL